MMWTVRTTPRCADVTEHLTEQDLTKAAANLRQIEDYLGARVQWQLKAGTYDALKSVDQAASTISRINCGLVTARFNSPGVPDAEAISPSISN